MNRVKFKYKKVCKLDPLLNYYNYNTVFQSTKCGDKIDLFTTLVGQKKSLGRLQEKLSRSKEVKKWILNEFCQGKTMRWCLAWTFKVSFLPWSKTIQSILNICHYILINNRISIYVTSSSPYTSTYVRNINSFHPNKNKNNCTQ